MSAMTYRRSALYRYRALAVVAVFCVSIFLLTSHQFSQQDPSTSSASIIKWMKDGGYDVLLPTNQEGQQGLQGQGASNPASSSSKTAVPTGSLDLSPSTGSLLDAHPNEKVLQLQTELSKQSPPMDPLTKEFMSWRDETYSAKAKPPPKPPRQTAPPIPDPFPLLSQTPVSEVRKQLVVPEINRPPRVHVPEATPLLIGFTRNWPQLLQCVASYITAGWPAEDIYVVENTGVMHANRDDRLTLQNPFYLNHTQLRILGVHVIETPTLMSFAQLQNFYAWTALERNWTEFFWSHQDVVAFSFEKEFRPHTDDKSIDNANYSLYTRAVAILRFLRQPGTPKWANHFFAYDHLTLVHRDAVLDIGGWDTHIPFYATDCDFYLRQKWQGYFQGSTQIGIIIDTSTVLDDFAALFRIPGVHATFQGDPGAEAMAGGGANNAENDALHSTEFAAREAERKKLVDTEGETVENLVDVSYRMQAVKYIDGGSWRNLWQLRQGGGQGEPFYRDQEGFQIGLDTQIEVGRRVFSEKWGHRGCDIFDRTANDAWKLQRDWDVMTEGQGHEGPYW